MLWLAKWTDNRLNKEWKTHVTCLAETFASFARFLQFFKCWPSLARFFAKKPQLSMAVCPAKPIFGCCNQRFWTLERHLAILRPALLCVFSLFHTPILSLISILLSLTWPWNLTGCGILFPWAFCELHRVPRRAGKDFVVIRLQCWKLQSLQLRLAISGNMA